MTSVRFTKKIKNYAVISFILPLLAINSCLLIYKVLGNFKYNLFPDLNWSKVEHSYKFSEYDLTMRNTETYTFTNCPMYDFKIYGITTDSQTILSLEDLGTESQLSDLGTNNKIKTILIKHDQIPDSACIKNNQFLYSLIKKFGWLETMLIHTIQKNTSGFAKTKNPYFYGEVSISRTARYFPAVIIFKPLIILSALALFIYWKNNLNLFNELKNNSILVKFSKKFFYMGVFSCIFLILHTIFLGLDFDSKLFSKIRKLVIILFILFEVLAQILLTKNLFIFREELKKYINPLILKIKITFVAIVLLTTCVAFTILGFGEPSTAFKHTLEWNYFSFLLLYYLLSRLLWK